MHVGFGADEVLGTAGTQRVQNAQVVIFEADLDKVKMDRRLFAEHGLLPQHQSLRELVGEKAWSPLAQKLAGIMPPPKLDPLQPWVALLQFTMEQYKDAFDRLGHGSAKRQLDAEIRVLAHDAGRALEFLETDDEHIGLFSGVTSDHQVALLRDLIESDQRRDADALLAAYVHGDEKGLEQIVLSETPAPSYQTPVFNERFLFERNVRWMPRIAAACGKGNAVVAVGAAHLFGPRGLRALLANLGFSVQRRRS